MNRKRENSILHGSTILWSAAVSTGRKFFWQLRPAPAPHGSDIISGNEPRQRKRRTDAVGRTGEPLLDLAGHARKLAVVIRRLAERYASHPALGGWHVSNEYNGACYCGLCRKEFVDFLKQRYGSLERLNEVYWSAFWGHRYSAWEQVDPNDRSMDLARVDFLRFNSAGCGTSCVLRWRRCGTFPMRPSPPI